MKNLLLTGCAGFIGYNFLRHFIDSGSINEYSKIVSIDKMGYATIYNKEEYETICSEQGIAGICTNVTTLPNDALDKYFDDAPVDVLSFASESHVDNSISSPELTFLENVQIPVSILNMLKIYDIDTYWHISTDEVYGDLSLDVVNDSSKWFTTTSQYIPSNPYSASKVAQDAYLHSIKHTFGLNLKIIRMANQFGCYQHPEKMIPASIIRAINGQPIKVYGEGKNIRQWTYVEDTVKIINKLLLEGTDAYITHLADVKNLFDNNFIANKIKESLERHNIKADIQYIDDRLGHDRAYALSVTPEIEREYNESFNVSLDRTVDYYIERKDIWQI